jgi:hypothetical protein
VSLQFDRTKRTLGDNAKRGYNKKCEDAFADLEKIAAALPADQAADQFKGLLLACPRCAQRPPTASTCAAGAAVH